MYQYFTAFDLGYAWWAAHLARSIYVNSPKSNFTAFLVLKKDDTSIDEIQEIKKIFYAANPNCNVVVDEFYSDNSKNWMPRLAAGFRTYVFGPKRSSFFDDEDALVWIDADSIVRGDLLDLEVFAEDNVFDMSARSKKDSMKFASGLVIQKPTLNARMFGNTWHKRWKKRFEDKEWTADQNGFNDTASEMFKQQTGKTIGAPKSFCDVWLSNDGLIWQAKHQTKMKKAYIDEMKKYEPNVTDSILWNKIKNSTVQVGIDTFAFDYDKIEFTIMGIEGEDQFELIKKNKTFYNVGFLEALSKLGNSDALVISGAGIQNDTVYLSAFTNTFLSLSIEPNWKMIDVGLRNGQNNPGAKRSIFVDDAIHPRLKQLGIRKDLFTLYTNWTAYFQESGQPVPIAFAGVIQANGMPTRLRSGVGLYAAYPEDLLFGTDEFLKSELYKKMGRARYCIETQASIVDRNKWLNDNSCSIDMIKGVIAAPLDVFIESAYLGIRNDGVFNKRNPTYNFNNFLGMLLINIFDYSEEALSSGMSVINHFSPHIGIVVYNERDKKQRISNIDKLLGPGYRKAYEMPDELDESASCIVYESLRRSNE